jgi:aryl-alcohol dehydrogenase-like predicted oxidoreductase
MEHRRLGTSELEVSVICLGTWAFGNDNWWGYQSDKDSLEVLEQALNGGINFIDTAPVYGRGHSEKVIGSFNKKRKLRDKMILATKLGLRWEGRKILHDLSRNRMLAELDESRKRLNTDYFDLYQVHWPDPDIPIRATAELMYDFYKKGIIKAVGVSNYSVEQMKEFMRYCPIHSLQPFYNMFVRDIEQGIIPYCIEKSIGIITYAPLHSGLLTGKFFLDGVKVPNDINRMTKKKDLEEPHFSINKEALLELKRIADKYVKTLAQLAINWNYNQKGITSCIVGTRKFSQLEDNCGGAGWKLSGTDKEKIEHVLGERLVKIKESEA